MSNIVQAATSQNSQIQLKEQSSLSEYIQSYEEKEIVQAVEGSKQIAKVESREELINAVVKWRNLSENSKSATLIKCKWNSWPMTKHVKSIIDCCRLCVHYVMYTMSYMTFIHIIQAMLFNNDICMHCEFR